MPETVFAGDKVGVVVIVPAGVMVMVDVGEGPVIDPVCDGVAAGVMVAVLVAVLVWGGVTVRDCVKVCVAEKVALGVAGIVGE